MINNRPTPHPHDAAPPGAVIAPIHPLYGEYRIRVLMWSEYYEHGGWVLLLGDDVGRSMHCIADWTPRLNEITEIAHYGSLEAAYDAMDRMLTDRR